MSSALRDAITALFTPRTPARSSEETNEGCARYAAALRKELGLPPDTPWADVCAAYIRNKALHTEVKTLIQETRGIQ